MATGKRIGAFALTEPGTGSDALMLSTTAVQDGDDYVLNGTKHFITNAEAAEIFVVFVTHDRALRWSAAVDVERDGVGAGERRLTLGSTLVPSLVRLTLIAWPPTSATSATSSEYPCASATSPKVGSLDRAGSVASTRDVSTDPGVAVSSLEPHAAKPNAIVAASTGPTPP